MSPRLPLAVAAGLVLAATPAAARADTLETPAPGAANLAAGGSWLAWSAAQPDGTFRLQVRRPDGTVFAPAIPAFRAPVRPVIGTREGGNSINTPASRRISAAYARCAGTSSLSGCDIYALDLTRLTERKVRSLSTRTYSETAPSLDGGRWSVVRRGGPRPGVYTFAEHSGVLRRLSRVVGLATATSPGRVLFSYREPGGAYGIRLQRNSGGAARIAARGLDREPVALQLTRYRAGWLVPRAGATHVFLTERFVGSEFRQFPLGVHEAARTLPPGVRSAAGDQSRQFTRYLDGAGVQRIDPPIIR